MTEPKKKVGRPQTGETHPHPTRGYEDDRGLELIEKLRRARGVSSTAGLYRLLVREAAKREGLE